jgi:two-component system chemotaxis sensor kinase CheA
VDNLIGQQQVVVKTIPDYIKKSKLVEGISGCTLLGDGSISLILDAAWLVNTDIN